MGGRGQLDVALVCTAFPEMCEPGPGGRVMGTQAHPHWDRAAEQLDFFHGAAGK